MELLCEKFSKLTKSANFFICDENSSNCKSLGSRNSSFYCRPFVVVQDEEIDEDAALGEDDAGLEETIKTKRRQEVSLDESDLDLNSDEEEDGEESGEESDGEDERELELELEEEEEEEDDDDDEKYQQMLEAVTGKPQQSRNGMQVRVGENLFFSSYRASCMLEYIQLGVKCPIEFVL